MIGRFRHLREAGLIGINARNVDFVSTLNEQRLMPRVNDKVETKRICEAAGVPTPTLYATIEINAHVRSLERHLAGRERFVVKPAKGSQGKGIMVIDGRVNGNWRTTSGRLVTDDRLKSHLSNVISGMYSLGGLGDVAMLEEVVTFADTFARLSISGVPDIRIIALYGVPAMAMVRLPTRESDGKANLHRGGIGVGVDIETGQTTYAVHKNRIVDAHPDTGTPVADIQLPNWDDMLLMAARCYEPTGLAYLGADIVIDADKGPQLLELNARPGLSVQLANATGLRPRLDAILEGPSSIDRAEDRVAWAKRRFGATRPAMAA